MAERKWGKVQREISQINMLKYYPFNIEHEIDMDMPTIFSVVDDLL